MTQTEAFLGTMKATLQRSNGEVYSHTSVPLFEILDDDFSYCSRYDYSKRYANMISETDGTGYIKDCYMTLEGIGKRVNFRGDKVPHRLISFLRLYITMLIKHLHVIPIETEDCFMVSYDEICMKFLFSIGRFKSDRSLTNRFLKLEKIGYVMTRAEFNFLLYCFLFDDYRKRVESMMYSVSDYSSHVAGSVFKCFQCFYELFDQMLLYDGQILGMYDCVFSRQLIVTRSDQTEVFEPLWPLRHGGCLDLHLKNPQLIFLHHKNNPGDHGHFRHSFKVSVEMNMHMIISQELIHLVVRNSVKETNGRKRTYNNLEYIMCYPANYVLASLFYSDWWRSAVKLLFLYTEGHLNYKDLSNMDKIISILQLAYEARLYRSVSDSDMSQLHGIMDEVLSVKGCRCEVCVLFESEGYLDKYLYEGMYGE